MDDYEGPMMEEAATIDLQGTPEWYEDRRGRFGASGFADLAWDKTPYKSGPRKDRPRPSPASRNNQIDRVVAEILTGQYEKSFTSKPTDWGIAMEPEALAAYEAHKGFLVEQVGFQRHPVYGFAGASPDALAEDEIGLGGVEAKCPYSASIHAKTLREGLPPEHIGQIQGGLWITGRNWWDFISYHPNFPEHLRLYIQRVYRDEKVIQQIETDVLSAWSEVCATIDLLDPTVRALP